MGLLLQVDKFFPGATPNETLMHRLAQKVMNKT